eukprot:gb/GECG01000460.1/.p1 GENE.gb/GECG01000460.1/~~gb/GECG01000460.1/.p1  ORF type:complete len:125 (+),score=9.24 gb/GECG01000460.1/:1-375(+)
MRSSLDSPPLHPAVPLTPVIPSIHVYASTNIFATRLTGVRSLLLHSSNLGRTQYSIAELESSLQHLSNFARFLLRVLSRNLEHCLMTIRIKVITLFTIFMDIMVLQDLPELCICRLHAFMEIAE